MRWASDPPGFSAVLYSVLIMTASEGERPRVRWRIQRKCRTIPQVLYLALRTTGLPPSPTHPPNLLFPHAAKRLRNSGKSSLQFLRRSLGCTTVQFPARTWRTFEFRLDLLAEPPHCSRNRLSQIESGVLRAAAQLLDLTLERSRQL